MSDSERTGKQEMNNRIRESFDTVAEGYDNPSLRYFAMSAAYLPGYLNLKGNENVLDVATGTGHAAISLAEALPQGHVTGIDFSEGMLARARKKIADRGIGNIDLRFMDMETLDFPDNMFDAAVLSFSIFFVEDMEGLLRHIMDKVKPGGKVLATGFYDGTFSPLIDMFFDCIKKYRADEQPPSWRFSKPEECRSLFEKAGLSRVSIDTRDLSYNLADAGQWWDMVWNAGLRRYLNGFSPEILDNFKGEHLKEIDGLTGSDGIRLNVKVLYVLGSKDH